MGKATLVSTLPFKLSEPKPGLHPSLIEVNAAEYNDFSLTYLEDGHHLILMPGTDDKTPPIKITDTAEKIAQGVIDDYTNANLAVTFEPTEDGTIPKPGMFWIEGEVDKGWVRKNFSKQLGIAFRETAAWFERLVKLADDDWSRYHQHGMITDLQRKACNYLQLKNREWNFEVMEILKNLCWACKVSVHPDALICSNCKCVLKPEEFAKRKGDFINAQA